MRFNLNIPLLWDTLSVVWTLRPRLQISCRSARTTTNRLIIASDWMYPHTKTTVTHPKKKKWALINKREEHQVKSFVFYRYERVKNVRLFHFLRLHIRPFVQRSSPSSKNSSIAFNLLIYSIKCQVRLRWSQNSSSPLSHLWLVCWWLARSLNLSRHSPRSCEICDRTKARRWCRKQKITPRIKMWRICRLTSGFSFFINELC